ncbi:hypothetical protein Hanom_Chr04g00378901 [Helianthus anomalus]
MYIIIPFSHQINLNYTKISNRTWPELGDKDQKAAMTETCRATPHRCTEQ